MGYTVKTPNISNPGNNSRPISILLFLEVFIKHAFLMVEPQHINVTFLLMRRFHSKNHILKIQTSQTTSQTTIVTQRLKLLLQV